MCGVLHFLLRRWDVSDRRNHDEGELYSSLVKQGLSSFHQIVFDPKYSQIRLLAKGLAVRARNPKNVVRTVGVGNTAGLKEPIRQAIQVLYCRWVHSFHRSQFYRQPFRPT